MDTQPGAGAVRRRGRPGTPRIVLARSASRAGRGGGSFRVSGPGYSLKQTEVVATSASPEYPQQAAGEDQVPLDELIAQTPGAHPIISVDELRCDAFDTDEELDEFLAFVIESRHADLA